MRTVIGDFLPVALGVAISPVPIIAVVLMLLAVKEWRSPPRPGDTPELPNWVSAIDSITSVKAFGLGGAIAGKGLAGLGVRG